VLYFLHSDHLGSTSLTTDASGNAVARQLYDAWGSIRTSASSGTMPTDIGYTGQRGNLDIGLLFYNARFYSAYLNRWLSPDTIVPDPKNPQSLNRFSYNINNPLKYIDPSGHYYCYGEDSGWGGASCQDIVEKWLEYLKSYGGDLGADLVKKFRTMDENELIHIDFTSTLCDTCWAQTDTTSGNWIRINSSPDFALNKPYATIAEFSSKFGHELHHLVNQKQPIYIGSVLGEKEAYEVTWQLQKNMGLDPEKRAGEWSLLGLSHRLTNSDEDLKYIQEMFMPQTTVLRPPYQNEPFYSSFGARVKGGWNRLTRALGVTAETMIWSLLKAAGAETP
jgi:RHS repeat-associated protein